MDLLLFLGFVAIIAVGIWELLRGAKEDRRWP